LKRLNRRHQLEDFQQTLSDASRFLNDGFTQAQARREPESAPKPFTPLVTVRETIQPVIRTEEQSGTAPQSAPSPSSEPEGDLQTVLMCTPSDGLVNVQIRTLPAP
jgi:hypothetical protein